jgi:thiamine biosynthesis lipoprotein
MLLPLSRSPHQLLALWLMLASAFLGLATVYAQAEPLERIERTERHMGVDFTIIAYTPPEKAKTALDAAFAKVAEVDKVCSDYEPESELSRLSASSPHVRPQPVGPLLGDILAKSQQFAKDSDGAFDCTVGNLTKLWRRAKRQVELPPADQLAEALKATGYKHLVVSADQKTAQLLLPKMRLDLGGIGQGYAVDLAMKVLHDHGITKVLIDGSGDVLLADPPPGKDGWLVEIAPIEPKGEPTRHLRLAHCAISTSGDAFRGVEIEGRRYSHIVDPKTGVGLPHRTSVTIIAPDCTTADAMATAASVMGRVRGTEWIAKHPKCAALFVQIDDGSSGPASVTATDNFPDSENDAEANVPETKN